MGVPAFGVVKHFDVIKNVLPGRLSDYVGFALDAFTLE